MSLTIAPRSGEHFENQNPADTTDVIGRFPLSTREDVDAAVQSAWRGFEQWRRTPAPARGDVLRRIGDIMTTRKEEIADLAVYLAGATFTTGRAYVIDGGWSL